MKCVHLVHSSILCLFIVPSLATKPYRSASYSYTSQVFPVEGFVDTYMIYVAGEVVTIEIPASVESNLLKIVQWKVFNTDVNRLMLISNYRAFILMDQIIMVPLNKIDNYLLSGKIIVLGNNRAIHARLLDNLELGDNYPDTYIDLLYFNVEKKSMDIIDQITWKSNDESNHDGKHVGYWSIIDYIFIKDKLYLAIGREVGTKVSNDIRLTPQISIMRLCLDRGNDILRSAVEVYFHRPFTTLGYFVFKLGDLHDESRRLSLLVQKSRVPGSFNRYYIRDYATIFDEVARNCTSGQNGSTTMHDVLLKTQKKCDAVQMMECDFPKFVIPSFRLRTMIKYNEVRTMYRLMIIHDGYPFNETRYIFHDSTNIYDCLLRNADATSTDACIERPIASDPPFYFFNYVTSTLFWLDKNSNNFIHEPFECSQFNDCFNCIMFGSHSKCIWNGYSCLLVHSAINVIPSSARICGEVTTFKPKSVSTSVKSQNISINFSRVPWTENVNYKIYVTIGPNPCHLIFSNYSFSAKYKIICQIELKKKGSFHINLTFAYEHYGNTVPIALVSQRSFLIHDDFNYTNDVFLVIAKFAAAFIIIFVLSAAFTFLYCPIGSERRKSIDKRLNSSISLRKRSMANITGRKPKSMSPKLKWKEFSTLVVKYSSDSLKSASKH